MFVLIPIERIPNTLSPCLCFTKLAQLQSTFCEHLLVLLLTTLYCPATINTNAEILLTRRWWNLGFFSVWSLKFGILLSVLSCYKIAKQKNFPEWRCCNSRNDHLETEMESVKKVSTVLVKITFTPLNIRCFIWWNEIFDVSSSKKCNNDKESALLMADDEKNLGVYWPKIINNNCNSTSSLDYPHKLMS